MSLNHRTSNRAPLALEVKVRHMGKEMGETCTRNISPFGAFIEMPHPELRPDDFIELYFTDEQQNDAQLLQKGLINPYGEYLAIIVKPNLLIGLT